MKYVVIDTETTGLPDWKQPSEDTRQARIGVRDPRDHP